MVSRIESAGGEMDIAAIQGAEKSDASDSPVRVPAALPPLRLHHFFAFTAVSALLLSSFGPAINNLSNNKNFGRYWLLLAIGGTIYSLLVAFAITVTAYGIAWHRKGVRYPKCPGHWLLVAITASYVLGLLLGIIIPRLIGRTGWFFFIWNAPIVCVNIWIGWTKCTERRWRWVFYLRGLATIVSILGELPLLVMISRANLIDRKLGVERDILHRSGVTIQILQSLLVIGFFFYVMLAVFMH